MGSRIKIIVNCISHKYCISLNNKYYWKLCFVSLVLKSGNVFFVTNYGSIPILSQIVKLLKLIILKKKFQPIIYPIIMEEPHDFRPGRSTTTCNIGFCYYIFETL